MNGVDRRRFSHLSVFHLRKSNGVCSSEYISPRVFLAGGRREEGGWVSSILLDLYLGFFSYVCIYISMYVVLLYLCMFVLSLTQPMGLPKCSEL